MCMGGPSVSPPPPPPPPPPPAPQTPDAPIQAAGANARAKAANMAGPMSTITNAGGAAGLIEPPSTTAKSKLGG